MIVGGWEFVWAAYGVVWTSLLVYGGTLYWRWRASERDLAVKK